jgi:mRNA interferase RelE/StbE
MGLGISEFKSLEEEVRSDIRDEEFQPDERKRLKKTIRGINTRCVLGSRDPRTHPEYEQLGHWGDWQFYRKWMGQNFARLIFAVKDDQMVLVAVIRKDDHVYDVDEYGRRMARNQDQL